MSSAVKNINTDCVNSTHRCYSAHRKTVTHRNTTSSWRQYSTSPQQCCSQAVHCNSGSPSPRLHYITAANLSGLQEHDSSHFTAISCLHKILLSQLATGRHTASYCAPLQPAALSVIEQSSDDRTPRVSNSTSKHAHGQSLALALYSRDRHLTSALGGISR